MFLKFSLFLLQRVEYLPCVSVSGPCFAQICGRVDGLWDYGELITPLNPRKLLFESVA